MKKIALVFGTFLALFMVSCEGPSGPPGLDGLDGLDGEIGITYEIDNVDFLPTNDLFRFTFPQNIVNGDAVLVYRLEAVQDGLDIWEPLPTATIFFDTGGFLQYRFNYTLGDVDIIIESDDLNTIGTEFMLDQVFRIIVLPSDLVGTIDTTNIHEVLSEIGLKETNIQHINLD